MSHVHHGFDLSTCIGNRDTLYGQTSCKNSLYFHFDDCPPSIPKLFRLQWRYDLCELQTFRIHLQTNSAIYEAIYDALP